MKPVTVDAFSPVPYGGNPAGVAVYEHALPSEAEMRSIAREIGYSETAFVLPLSKTRFLIRYFTPVEEVPLCGHATIGTFAYLLSIGMIADDSSLIAETKAGDIGVIIENSLIWLDMAKPKELKYLSDDDSNELLNCFGFDKPASSCFGALCPAISDTGLADIMLPLASQALLNGLKPDMARIAALSKRLCVTGVHAFVNAEDAIHCRNFAPLYGIDEEAATGTSNGALTYYLYKNRLIEPDRINLFIQGEAMNRPSRIYSRLSMDETSDILIRIGGNGAVRE